MYSDIIASITKMIKCNHFLNGNSYYLESMVDPTEISRLDESILSVILR